MKDLEILEYYKWCRDYAKKEIEWCTKQIEYCNRQLKRTTQEDGEFIEYIWNRGVVTKLDWECFLSKPYVSGETRKLINERAKYYRWRIKHKKELARRLKQIAEMEG